MLYITPYEPPQKRRGFVVEGIEHKFSEAAVMLAYAFHLLDEAGGGSKVTIHPDGEHAKIFDISGFLLHHGFARERSIGSTLYGGHYVRGDHTVIVNPRSGQGDVVGELDGRRVVAECKGGTINSNHPGQKSRLRKGLAELIGQLMVRDVSDERQVAVLPSTTEVERLAVKLARRCAGAGIEIALIEHDGRVRYIAAP
ncbi:hypothetical protein ASC75_02465 [Aminobacter sp. DSM 101952]|uniref:hypothetical protein n=1 Tax=Aminobacter sp. DSM 101952 TaxID=2735891 RepID=UPI0006F78983|nr:hypothetical protein [Aminobacter sp. DSM 101952]KQU76498.1 hypothetical protein ASC75_02465 [Aminobacter sp. DSM 101952]